MGIALVTWRVAPRRDVNRRFFVSLISLTIAILTAYATANPFVLLAVWILPILLFRPRLVLAASALALAIGMSLTGPWASAFLALAVIMRAGIFPFHRATLALFESNALLLAGLLINSHLGVLLMTRAAIGAEALPWIGGSALFSTLYTAVLGMTEREPRRALVLTIVSQSATLIAGLATRSHEGVGGVLVQ